MTWTLFWDMHSGGGTKEGPYEYIYIEAPEAEAKVIFYNRFGHNPERVTCTCCGEDYSIDESPTLEKASEWHRTNDFAVRRTGPLTVDEYVALESVLVIRADEIKSEERVGSVPEAGYVWVGE